MIVWRVIQISWYHTSLIYFRRRYSKWSADEKLSRCNRPEYGLSDFEACSRRISESELEADELLRWGLRCYIVLLAIYTFTRHILKYLMMSIIDILGSLWARRLNLALPWKMAAKLCQLFNNNEAISVSSPLVLINDLRYIGAATRQAWFIGC